MVQSRLRPFAWLATLASVGASTALIAACSGKVSNGSVSSTSQPVSVGDISGTATACNAGFAHPNACCEAGPNAPTACVVYPNAPFTQCESGRTTYPDPRTCCPLDGQGACAAPPPQTLPIDDGGTGSGGACVYPCPVGWYSPPSQAGSSGSSGGNAGLVGVTCCETGPDGSSQCMGGGSAGGGCTCACPSCDSDGSCPPCPPCNCPAQPPQTQSCDPCPPGWQTPQGDPLLCCSTAPDGTISCFSQGVPPPPPGNPSTPASCFGGGGGGPDGSTFTQCGCSETVNGNDYTVTCTDPGGTCVCSVGSGSSSGSTTGTTVTEPPTSCNDVGALFNACGFPSSGVSGLNGGTSGSGSAGSSSSSSGG